MVRTLPSDVSPRLDVPRILAISFAMAVHALALLVLLLPLTQAPPVSPVREETPPRWEVPRIIPVTPLPPQPVVHETRTTPPRTPTTVQRIAPVPAPVIVDQGALQADPPAAVTGSDIGPVDIGQPLQGAQLRYAAAPAPRYPRDAIASGAEGTVLLRVLVDIDGQPLEVVVERSSGHRSLDREAVRHVQQRWRFEPAMRDGRAVQAWGLVPIDFSLQ